MLRRLTARLSLICRCHGKRGEFRRRRRATAPRRDARLGRGLGVSGLYSSRRTRGGILPVDGVPEDRFRGSSGGLPLLSIDDLARCVLLLALTFLGPGSAGRRAYIATC